MICAQCFQSRRRSFFTADGVCEECVNPYPVPPRHTPGDGPYFALPSVIVFAAEWDEGHAYNPEGTYRDMIAFLALHPDHQCTPPMWLWDTISAWLAELHKKPESQCTDWECEAVLLWRTGWVTPDTMKLAVSIFHRWKAERERVEPPPPPKPALVGKHYGTVGERTNIPGCQCYEHKALGPHPEHPEWGDRFLIKFTAATGEELVWFASAGGKFDPQIGGTYNVRGTVFKHDKYQGKASTIIQRCEEYDPATGKALHPRTRKKKDEDE